MDAGTPIWAERVQDRQNRDQVILTQRCYLLATVLDHVGLLDEITATTAREALIPAHLDEVVHDPFTGAERPVREAIMTLTKHPLARD